MTEFELLASVVEEITGTSQKTLVSKKRTRKLVELRMICANILKESNEDVTLLQIGDMLNVNHSSISHYTKTHQNLVYQKNGKFINNPYKELYDSINQKYQGKLLYFYSDEIKYGLVNKKAELEKMLSDVNSALTLIETKKNSDESKKPKQEKCKA